MTPKIYASLFRRRDKVAFIASVGIFTLSALAVSPSSKRLEGSGLALMLILIPPLCLGALFAEVWKKLLQRSSTALAPGVQRTLFQWHSSVILAGAIGWGVIVHWIQPAIPLAAAIGISAGMSTLPLPFTLGRPLRPKNARLWRGLFWFWISINVPHLLGREWVTQFLMHAPVIGAAGVVLTLVNLWFAQKKRRPAIPVSPRNNRLGFGKQLAAIFRRFTQGKTCESNPTWSYPPRGTSLLHWVRAAFQERPSGFSINVAGCVLVLLIHPFVSYGTASYPLGWYRLVFAPDQFSPAVLMVALLVSSLGAGFLRTGQLYPLSRPRRASIAYTASNAIFLFSFLTLVGGSLLAGWIVGRLLGLPLPPQPAAEFIVRMAMVVPIMPLMRWNGLRLESSQSWGELFPFISFVAVLLLISQKYILNAGAVVGAAVCVVAIIGSQILYRGFLRDFYIWGDLVQRGTERPTASRI